MTMIMPSGDGVQSINQSTRLISIMSKPISIVVVVVVVQKSLVQKNLGQKNFDPKNFETKIGFNIVFNIEF